MTTRLHERVRRIRERALIRAWEYRQRMHSKGVWFRLRRVLVDAESAFSISEREADWLESQGQQPLAVGRELSPAKRVFFVRREQLRGLQALELPVRLAAPLLQATSVVLVAHRPDPDELENQARGSVPSAAAAPPTPRAPGQHSSSSLAAARSGRSAASRKGDE